MRLLKIGTLVMGLSLLAAVAAQAMEFKLSNGDILKGEIASIAEEGLVVRLDSGGFSERVSWAKLTQETLKMLAENPQAKPVVEPFIEIPLEVKAKNRPKKKLYRATPANRVELPPENGEIVATVTAPINLTIIGLLFLANLYAAYEIAIFRGRPVALVCGMSVILPVVTPIMFLSLPGVEEAAEIAAPVVQDVEYGYGDGYGAAVASSGGLSVARGEKSTGGGLEPALYKRGDTTFNRRFFETKFAGFFRVVLGDKEKQMVIAIRTSRDEYVARRIARITGNEMHIQLLNGSEVPVSFSDIAQVHLRPKDD